MKNKKKFAFLTLAMTIGMVLGACNKTETSSVDKASSGPANTSSAGPVVTSSNVSSNSVAPSTSKPTSSSSVAPSSSKPSSSSSAAPSSAAPSSSTPVVNKYTVKFVVNGVEVQTGEVEEGQTAPYNGETPTKDGDANAIKYRFKGWDKDLTQPITQDTTFTAVFAEYVRAQEVDNFESYTSTSALGEAWTVQAYKNDAWGDTAASVSIGSKTTGGSKSLRFDGWENGTGFRFLKHFEANAFPKAANAVAFSMQIPSINTVKVILKGRATIAGQVQEPSFTYEFHPTTSEYVDYVIPLADDAWQLWGKAGDSIKSVANWTGIHEDDFVNYITDVGFFVQGSDGGSNLPYFAFVDTISFVTVDEPAQVIKNETMGAYTKYTGLLNDGHTVKVEIGEAGSATATIIDMETPMQIPGTVSMDADHNLRFASADGGSTLIYTASYKNGGQSLKFVSASGALAQGVIGVDLNAVQVVDNYEQYTTDGQAYYKDKPADQRSGCRGAYYSEYYAGEGNSSPWGGNKWSLLGGDGSQLKLKQDQAGAHSGKNYL